MDIKLKIEQIPKYEIFGIHKLKLILKYEISLLSWLILKYGLGGYLSMSFILKYEIGCFDVINITVYISYHHLFIEYMFNFIVESSYKTINSESKPNISHLSTK